MALKAYELEVTLSELATLTGCNRTYLTPRLASIIPHAGKGNTKVYSLQQVLSILVRPPREDKGDKADPDNMAPSDRKAWYDSEMKKRQVQERDRELIPASEVEACIATAYASVSQGLRAIPDNLERQFGISPELAESVGIMIENQMDALADKLNEIGTAQNHGGQTTGGGDNE